MMLKVGAGLTVGPTARRLAPKIRPLAQKASLIAGTGNYHPCAGRAPAGRRRIVAPAAPNPKSRRRLHAEQS
jgi:hypothetical protein